MFGSKVVEGPGWQYPARGGRYGYCGMFLNGRRCGDIDYRCYCDFRFRDEFGFQSLKVMREMSGDAKEKRVEMDHY